MGSWEWDITTNELVWSDEVYRLYGLDPAKDHPKYDVVVNNLTPETRDWFLKAIDNALKQRQSGRTVSTVWQIRQYW